MQETKKKMLFVGEQWFGSDARSMCVAFRRSGWEVGELDPMRYMPQSATMSARITAKLFRPIFRQSLNAAILREAKKLNPSVVFIYKGPGVYASTVSTIRHQRHFTAMYYPDVSLYTHGSEIPKCVPHYDIIFTSKSWGVTDLLNLGASDVSVVLHGFDTDTLVGLPQNPDITTYDCDASFIGTWSPWKEKLLSELKAALPALDLKIYGSLWDRATSKHLKTCIQFKTVEGHAYISTMRRSKINIAILSESRHGASHGDTTTSRTFNIPAAGAFMLHQRTDELLSCFKEGDEVAAFANSSELVEKTALYLQHNDQRLRIMEAGRRRALTEHTSDHRAAKISEQLQNRLGLVATSAK
jgi:spore maturation protein CgeB